MTGRNLLLIILLVSTTCTVWAAPLGLEAALDPTALVFPTQGRAELAATTAGDGAGSDFMPLKPGETREVIKLTGPCTILRIWSTSEFTEQTRLVAEVDGKMIPLWDKAKLAIGQKPGSLTQMWGQAFWTYEPITVKTSIRFIATDLRQKTEQTTAGKPAINKFYLQAGWCKGIIAQPSKEKNIAAKATHAKLIADVTSKEPNKNAQNYTLNLNTPVSIIGTPRDVVTALAITPPAGATFEQLAGTLLKISVDGVTCVNAPLPNLFCMFWGAGEIKAEFSPILVKQGKFILLLPIPIGTHLEISIEKYGKQKSIDNCQLRVLTQKLDKAPTYRLCAEYRSQVSQRDEPLVFAEVAGEGHLVGLALGVDGLEHLKFSFLEGNEQIMIDKVSAPAIEGTGTEDYFNSAWYFSGGLGDGLGHALTWLNEGPPPRVSALRLMLADRIGFAKGIRFCMQHGSRNSSPDTLYRSVAFWYQSSPQPVAEPVEPQITTSSLKQDIDAKNDNKTSNDWITPTLLAALFFVVVVVIIRRVRRRK